MNPLLPMLAGTFLLADSILTQAAETNNRPASAPRSNAAPPERLRVSDNQRFLVTTGGQPFFWLGDTAWELFHRLDRAEADLYLCDRAAKGFNVIQAVALAELDGLTEPNRYGHLPLEDQDPARPAVKPGPANDYWDFVDGVMDLATAQGLRIGFIPTWGKYVTSSSFDGKVDGIFNATNALAYGQFLGKRYCDRSNLIWILGGDKAPSTPEAVAIWRAMARGITLGVALLNPGRVNTESGDGGRVVLRVYTAYDDQNVYVAAAVREKQLLCRAGQPVTRRGRSEVVELPYRMGEPSGLEHIRFCGDAFFFAFGFRDRVPGWGRQMDDPWAWKGHFYDTDDHYAVHTSSTGPQLIRQWGADTSRRIAYQTAAVPGVGPVPGAQVRIARDEAAQLTVYEMSIPRAELKMFNPGAGRLRFGFNLVSNEVGWPLQWASAAGVFDYWIGSGSFSPSWVSVLPCQTFFGIEP